MEVTKHHEKCPHCFTEFAFDSTTSRPKPLLDRPSYETHSYERLPKRHGFIRLLKLHASTTNDSDVNCELIVTRFNDKGIPGEPYEALSWCWGSAPPDAYINVRSGGQLYAKYVKKDLVSALKALRGRSKDRYLWIDMVCFNIDLSRS